jgi:hypothetical protein
MNNDLPEWFKKSDSQNENGTLAPTKNGGR